MIIRHRAAPTARRRAAGQHGTITPSGKVQVLDALTRLDDRGVVTDPRALAEIHQGMLDQLKRMDGLVYLDANAVQSLDSRVKEKLKQAETRSSGAEK